MSLAQLCVFFCFALCWVIVFMLQSSMDSKWCSLVKVFFSFQYFSSFISSSSSGDFAVNFRAILIHKVPHRHEVAIAKFLSIFFFVLDEITWHRAESNVIYYSIKSGRNHLTTNLRHEWEGKAWITERKTHKTTSISLIRMVNYVWFVRRHAKVEIENWVERVLKILFRFPWQQKEEKKKKSAVICINFQCKKM